MDKKFEKMFKEDVNKSLNNNLNFDQIKNKIVINKNIDNKSYTQQYHTHTRFITKHWKIASALVSIIIIFSLSLLYIINENKGYKTSPFADQLQGIPFGKNIQKTNSQDTTISDLIDMQHNKDNPVYFYETKMKKVDNYYTCAYFPSKYYEQLKDKAVNYSISYNYSNEINIIDGKLITAYYDLINQNEIKWYQFSKDIKIIPEMINDYQLGLVLISRYAYFYENKTTKTKLDFKQKLFFREYYDINRDEFTNTNRNNLFQNNYKFNSLFASYSLVENKNKKEETLILLNSNLMDNTLILQEINQEKDKIGKYKSQLDTIKINEYYEDNILYGEYQYDKFCEFFLNTKGE